jgi:hypothetical protein
LLAVILALFAGAFFAVILSERRLEGSIPGRAAVTSLAALKPGFLVATSEGLFAGDGFRWAASARFRGPVATAGGHPLVASGEGLFVAASLDRFVRTASIPEQPVAVAALPDGAAVMGRSNDLYLTPDMAKVAVGDGPRPRGATALGVPGTGRLVFAAGPGTGVWRAELQDPLRWRQILRTSASAVLVEDPRVLLGTPGGLLVSGNTGQSWEFTEFRQAVDGLAQFGGRYFLISERLIYSSPDGEAGWVGLESTPSP